MPNGLDDSDLSEDDWKALLYRIEKGNCTPFLGAGVNSGILSRGKELAEKLAKKFEYPFKECSNLSQVAQFVAVNIDAVIVKERVVDLLTEEIEQKEGAGELPRLITNSGHPLSVLASLPLPVYITTNYDDLMLRALEAQPNKRPERELCRWNEYTSLHGKSVFDSASGFAPEEKTPLVFYLHGYNDVPQSLVLTEDDYVDFLVNLYRSEQTIVPPRVQMAMSGASVLFVGYALADWDFRVIFRGLVEYLERGARYTSVAVQLDPDEADEKEQEARRRYLTNYLGKLQIKIYWGRAEKFAEELRQRWEDYTKK